MLPVLLAWPKPLTPRSVRIFLQQGFAGKKCLPNPSRQMKYLAQSRPPEATIMPNA